MFKEISSQNQQLNSIDQTKSLKTKKNRRQNKQSDYRFKSYKYEENKHFNGKQNIQSSDYGFQKQSFQEDAQYDNQNDQSEYHNQEYNQNQNVQQGLFMPTDIIQFDDFEQDQQEIQKQDQQKQKRSVSVFQQEGQTKGNNNTDLNFDNFQTKLASRLTKNGQTKNSSQQQIRDNSGNRQFSKYNQENENQQIEENQDEKQIIENKKKQKINSQFQFDCYDQVTNQGGSIAQNYEMMATNCQDSNIRLKINCDIGFKSINHKNFSKNKKKFSYQKQRIIQNDPNYVLEKLFNKEDDIQQLNEYLNGQDIQIDQEIKGLKIQTDPDSSSVHIEITDKAKLAQSPLPPGITFKCTLRRSKNLLNLINPQFDLYITNGLKHIISAKKYSLKNRELFRFSLNIGNYENQSLIGKLNANLLHNEYWLTGKQQEMDFGETYASLYGAIMYEKLHKSQKQRKFSAVLPPISKKMSLVINSKATQIDTQWLTKEIKLVLKNLQNTEKIFSQSKMQSQKNFILYDGQDEQYPFLKFMKQSDNIFQLEINHPLSPLQAMAIALTRFDAQLK